MKHEADPKMPDLNGRTPLHHVKCSTCLGIILKEYQADISEPINLLNIQDLQGETPLMTLISEYAHKQVKQNVIKELLKHQLDFSIKNNDGNNALMVATSLN